MGLAGRKQKQRIAADPRNLSWADDASRFGRAYLSKFGWDASQGLGSSGDGMRTHIKVQQKLDMMGIGAQHQRDPNGIAWKQNKDFESLLKRLNEGAEQDNGAHNKDAKVEVESVGTTFVGAREENVEERSRDASSATVRKKRKHKDSDNQNTNANTRMKRRKEKKHQKFVSSDPVAPSPRPDSPSVPSSSTTHSKPIPEPRPMAHRARIRAAKRITGKSASAISEILGITPSLSVSTSSPPSTPPSSSTLAPQPNSLSLDNLTTSAKSVADYFKEKLFGCPASSASSSLAPSGSTTPGIGASSLGSGLPAISLSDDECEPQRRGIGSRVPPTPPLLHVPKLRSVSVPEDSPTSLSDKLRRKTERKAEKRRRREVEINHLTPENASVAMNGQVGEDDLDSDQQPSKEKTREERKQPTGSGQPCVSPMIPCREPKKSKRVHKKKRS